MTLLEEFAALLDELGLGTYRADGTPGGNVFLAVLPSTPDVALAVALYGGAESDARNSWDEPRLQVRVRGTATDARVAEQRAQAVYDAMHGLGYRHLTPGGTWLQLALGVNGGPAYLSRDENGRHEYVINFRCDLQRSTPNRV
ncbi:minor capsid protein [Streptosporangium saharense]|uniref:minor capsid protein n=1 Tax=Streptosporangium saharense TaxID=1706840 RepID=UPI0036B088AD